MSLGLMQSGKTAGSGGKKKKKPQYDPMLAAMLGEDEPTPPARTATATSTAPATPAVSSEAVVSTIAASGASSGASASSAELDGAFLSAFARVLNVLNDESATRDVRIRTIEVLALQTVPAARDALNIPLTTSAPAAGVVSADALSRALNGDTANGGGGGGGQQQLFALKSLLRRFTDPIERIRAAAIHIITHCVTALPDASAWYPLIVPILLHVLIRPPPAASAGDDIASAKPGAKLVSFKSGKRNPFHDMTSPAAGGGGDDDKDEKATPAASAAAATTAAAAAGDEKTPAAAAAPTGAVSIGYEPDESIRHQLLTLLHAIISKGSTVPAAALAAAAAAVAADEKDLDLEERKKLSHDRTVSALNEMSQPILVFVPDFVRLAGAALIDPAHDNRMLGAACLQSLTRVTGSALWFATKPFTIKVMDRLMPNLLDKAARVRLAMLDAAETIVPCGAAECIRDLAGFRESNVIDLREWMGAQVDESGSSSGGGDSGRPFVGRRNYFASCVVDANVKVRARFYQLICEWMTTMDERFTYETLLLAYVLSGVSDEYPSIATACYDSLVAIGEAHYRDNESALSEEAYWGNQAESIYRKHLVGLKPILPFPFTERPRLGLRHFIERFVPRYLNAICTELLDWQSTIRVHSVFLLQTLLVLHEDQITAHVPKLVPVFVKLCSAARDKRLQAQVDTCLELLGRFGHLTNTVWPELKRALLSVGTSTDDARRTSATLTVWRTVLRGAPPMMAALPIHESVELLQSDAFCCSHDADVFATVVDLSVQLIDSASQLDRNPPAPAAATAAAGVPASAPPTVKSITDSLYLLLVSLHGWRHSHSAFAAAAASKPLIAQIDAQLSSGWVRLAALSQLPGVDALHAQQLVTATNSRALLPDPSASHAAYAIGTRSLAVLASVSRIISALAIATSASNGNADAKHSTAGSASGGAAAGAATTVNAATIQVFTICAALLRPQSAAGTGTASALATQLRVIRLLCGLLQCSALPLATSTLDAAAATAAAGATPSASGGAVWFVNLLTELVRSAAATASASTQSDSVGLDAAAATGAGTGTGVVVHKTMIGKTTITEIKTAATAASSSDAGSGGSGGTSLLDGASSGSVSVRVLTAGDERRVRTELERQHRLAIAKEAIAALKALSQRGVLNSTAATSAASTAELELELGRISL